eukprot:gene2383-8691_t
MADSKAKKAQKNFKYLVLKGNESMLMTETLSRRGWWEAAKEGERWNLWWGANGQPFNFKTFMGAPLAMQICNRVEEHKVLCTKSGLSRVLDKILAEHGGNGSPEATPSSSASLAWIPESYVLPAKGADKKLYEQFRCAYERHVAGGTGSTWIVKPTSLNRGNGIEVFNKHEDIMTHLKSGDRTGSNYLVQKYIDNPLLVNGRKFDIRDLPSPAQPSAAQAQPNPASSCGDPVPEPKRSQPSQPSPTISAPSPRPPAGQPQHQASPPKDHPAHPRPAHPHPNPTLVSQPPQPMPTRVAHPLDQPQASTAIKSQPSQQQIKRATTHAPNPGTQPNAARPQHAPADTAPAHPIPRTPTPYPGERCTGAPSKKL